MGGIALGDWIEEFSAGNKVAENCVLCLEGMRGACMHFYMIRPGMILRSYIKYYCFMESEGGEDNVVERVIPTDNIQLMFHYKNAFTIIEPDGDRILQPNSLISGLCDSFSDVSTCGEAGVLFVAFQPAGACRFFNTPLYEFENKTIDLKDVLGNEIRRLEECIFLARSLDEKIKILEEYLLRQYASVSTFDHVLIDKSIALIKHYNGQIHASELAGELAVSVKTLERKFSEFIGTTPKSYIKLTRFQKILADFHQHGISLTDYAYCNGFFDQSHFIKDFKSYTGYCPKKFLDRYPCHNDLEKNMTS